jgi:hypothetical protein
VVDASERVFTSEDFKRLSGLVLDSWHDGLERDWSVPAGTLEWSCLATADHTIDCLFSYALFLASRKQDAYPNFGELHALPGASAADMIEGLRAVSTMLWAVIVTADPNERAIIRLGPQPETGSPQDFAARGALEMTLHAHDVCTGLNVPFDPPPDVCNRLLTHTADWPGQEPVHRIGDSWVDLVARSGRPRPVPE